MKEIVWEFIAPFDATSDFIYRAYRYPYSYVPQIPQPVETLSKDWISRNSVFPCGAAAGTLVILKSFKALKAGRKK